ncbi:MAG: hydrogenase maturation nickel metallochaperone HypA [Chlorobi bacterium]|nr:hydrogenase maturation nickel metallochaperone HypA [Chlorobiota bacterium]
MHELSIALGIVEIAEKEVLKAGASKVELIELEIGKLSGVEIEALNFAWPQATEGSVLETAEKKIYVIKGVAECLDCNIKFDIENIYDSCPKCNGYLKNIIQGKELRVKALTVD